MEQINVHWVGTSSHFLRESLIILIASKSVCGGVQTIYKLLVDIIMYIIHIENSRKVSHINNMKADFTYNGIFWIQRIYTIELALKNDKRSLSLLRCSWRIFGLCSTICRKLEKLGNFWKE